MVQQPAMQQMPGNPYQQPLDNTEYSNFDFSNIPSEQTFSDPSAFDGNSFAYNLNNSQQPTYNSNLAPVQSTELVRRSRNQQLAPQSAPQEQWNGYGNVSGQMDDEDEQDLDSRVQLAKKDTQGKRKQIPPFVQKLSR